MDKPSFKHCAVRALNLWVAREQQLSSSLQEPEGEAVRKSLAYYKVARGFPRLADGNVADKLAVLLRNHEASKTLDGAVASVQKFAFKLQKAAGSDKSVLSAASKLL